jgi:hypothetical protein
VPLLVILLVDGNALRREVLRGEKIKKRQKATWFRHFAEDELVGHQTVKQSGIYLSGPQECGSAPREVPVQF